MTIKNIPQFAYKYDFFVIIENNNENEFWGAYNEYAIAFEVANLMNGKVVINRF